MSKQKKEQRRQNQTPVNLASDAARPVITASSPPPPGTANRSEGAGVALDPGKYRGLLADEALSADQEREYIETVWAILLQAMLLGIRLEFDAKSCGQLSENPSAPPISSGNRVDWDGSNFREDFNSFAVPVRTAEGSEE